MVEVTDATLTKIQKNAVLKLIFEYGPPASEFQWSEKQQEESAMMSSWPYRVSVLTHRSTGYYCIFGAHSVTTCPGIARKVENFRHEDKWAAKVNACGRWLVDLKSELEAPDLWAAIAIEQALPIAAFGMSDNRLFTSSEQNLIASKLDEVERYLVEGQQFAAEQSQTLEREFAYLKDSSQRLGRKDWLNNLLGVFIGLVLALALDTTKAQGLLRLAGSLFQFLWNIPAQLP